MALKCVPGPQAWMTGVPFQQLANFVQSVGTGLNPEYPLGQRVVNGLTSLPAAVLVVLVLLLPDAAAAAAHWAKT
jgi:hypothetical protein